MSEEKPAAENEPPLGGKSLRAARWRRLRVGFLFATLGSILAMIGFATRMPGKSHIGALAPLTEEEAELRAETKSTKVSLPRQGIILIVLI